MAKQQRILTLQALVTVKAKGKIILWRRFQTEVDIYGKPHPRMLEELQGEIPRIVIDTTGPKGNGL